MTKMLMYISRMSCRNTKALVSSEMSLPTQIKFLFEVELTALEKETFRDLLQAALADLGLNSDGQPRSGSCEQMDLANTQRWITQLRQAYIS